MELKQIKLDYNDLFEGFTYLDELREGGSINMYDSAEPLSKHLGIGKIKARAILTYWIETFEDDLELDERVDQALERMSDDE